ncbi:CPBP family intramembrane glutamic endopeptidase [Companilactobacillus sp.]|jgi:membrane protease YdiL (CAAX protease family)|uniref:CPBP family intramembrane glutamic endopeptidase n=1 Tax=Companilactobacillus sp. TaxID=2767905 RepID=UPI0025C113D9|nr:CPBP family intramembrane glutamic endopeptidase [Companilactobacillus sp.]MCH4010169.1 CPBP family intramembrane metalloprotease [Companilactobacillus sp.]MCH4052155.1 CPBP family intramembrane metalloprotease [Companilactobacillus sp.]MCH4078111.1 CPBP family intramembrane metalloprotease [Companilactobacillus sp.]MCH4126687.1 CPBP family intramembrane metalloprotease [Companilactobacillus sp.]MCH4132272.1 CPBP family intramembrane metalloprotease [Companilactobacillus sp.]
MLLLLFNILGLFVTQSNLRSTLAKINWAIQAFAQAMLIPFSVSYLIILTKSFINWQSPFGLTVVIAYSVIMYIPYTYMLIVPVKTALMRIVLLIFSFFFTASSALDLMVDSTELASMSIIKTLSNTIFDGAIIMMIMVLVAMYAWGYGFPKYRLSKNINHWAFAAICLFTIWFALWNAFASGNTMLASLVTFSIKNLHFTANNILGGLEAGIAEEFIFRFGILTILMKAFYNSRNRFIYSAVISSILFGLMHGMNIFAGQDLGNTITQVIFAFAFGMYLAAVYLYTNAFYLTVFFHALIDVLVFLSSSNQLMTGKINLDSIIITVAESTVFIIIAILLLVNSQKKQNQTFQLFY